MPRRFHAANARNSRPGNIPYGDRNVNLEFLMAHEPGDRENRHETLLDAIRRYLATHPASADTFEGITGWVAR